MSANCTPSCLCVLSYSVNQQSSVNQEIFHALPLIISALWHAWMQVFALALLLCAVLDCKQGYGRVFIFLCLLLRLSLGSCLCVSLPVCLSLPVSSSVSAWVSVMCACVMWGHKSVHSVIVGTWQSRLHSLFIQNQYIVGWGQGSKVLLGARCGVVIVIVLGTVFFSIIINIYI